MRVATLFPTLILAVLDAVPSPAQAQLAPGERIRVTTDGWRLKPMVGTLESIDQDTVRLRMADSAASTPIPRAYIRRVEVSRGQRSNALGGAVVGAAFGAGVGVIVAQLSPRPKTCRFTGSYWFCRATPGSERNLASAALAGATLGAFLGLIKSAESSGERWERVPLSQLRVGLVVGSDGRAGLGLSFRF
ncbi:MAG: hypothetical protein ACREN5_09870 [Gemmatimonadales bacterium]